MFNMAQKFVSFFCFQAEDGRTTSPIGNNTLEHEPGIEIRELTQHRTLALFCLCWCQCSLSECTLDVRESIDSGQGMSI